jgi:hypothetical protein
LHQLVLTALMLRATKKPVDKSPADCTGNKYGSR